MTNKEPRRGFYALPGLEGDESAITPFEDIEYSQQNLAKNLSAFNFLSEKNFDEDEIDNIALGFINAHKDKTTLVPANLKKLLKQDIYLTSVELNNGEISHLTYYSYHFQKEELKTSA